MTVIRIAALLALLVVSIRSTSDYGAGIDPNGGRKLAGARCGDYTACIDPNG